MLEFYLNTTSPQWFGLDGNPFRDNSPSMAFQSRDTVKIIACTETPEAGEENVDPTSWPRDASWAAISGIGAKITVDNDYIHKLKGTLATEVPAGSTASISATIENVSYATIPANGTVRLFDASGNYEAIAYTARNISGNTVVFTTSGTLTGSYESGATMDCDQSPYCEAYLDTAQSNLEQGEFVFQLVVDSSRLREEMDYTNTARLDVQGLEMLVYKTVDGNDEPVKAYLCDTFSITGTIGNVGYEAEPPDPVKNQIAGIVNQLAAAGFEVEQQYDESGNTQFRFRSSSAGGTWSQWITVSKGEKGETGETGAAAGFGTPSVTVETLPAGSDATASVAASGDNTAKVFNFNLGIPRGADGKNGTDGADGAAGADGVSSYTYVAYASDASGTGFSLTPTNALKYRAEIHTTTAIETPDAEDFAGATWVKYLGDDGTGTGDMLKSVYDTDDDGIVDHAATADAVGATTAAQVADAVGKAHTHANKTTLDKLAETDGKLTYDGAEIGGSGTVKSVNGQLPDESGNVTVETGSTVDESRLLPENPANGDIPCFDATATVGGGNDANTKILLHFDADEIKDEAAGNAAPVTIKKKSGTITVVEGGKWGKCAKYVTGSMTVATNLDELNANNWVVSGWFNPDGTNHGVSYPAWLSMDDSSTNGFFFDSTGRYGESDGPLFYLDTPPAAGTWHWLAIVKYSGGLRFYLNGAFLNEISAQQRANFCSTLAIGGYAGTHAEGDTERTFSGLVDEVRLQYIPDDEITLWTGTSIAVPDAPYSKPQTVGEWGKLNKANIPVLEAEPVDGNLMLYTTQTFNVSDTMHLLHFDDPDQWFKDETGNYTGAATRSYYAFSTNITKFGTGGLQYQDPNGTSEYKTRSFNIASISPLKGPQDAVTLEFWFYIDQSCIFEIPDIMAKKGTAVEHWNFHLVNKMIYPDDIATPVKDVAVLSYHDFDEVSTYTKVETPWSRPTISEGWHHFAFCRDSAYNHYVFLDGAMLLKVLGSQFGSSPYLCPIVPDATTSSIGCDLSFDTQVLCYQDELRYSSVCLYTKNFVPPSEPFTYDAEAANKDVTGWFPASPGVIGLITGINNLIPSASGQLTIPEASKSFPGLMSATDKGKLDSFNITEYKDRPGYFKLPGGIIVQWGAVLDVSESKTFDVTLPVAFPHLGWVSLASGTSTTVATAAYFNGANALKVVTNVTGAGSFAVYWLAIGY